MAWLQIKVQSSGSNSAQMEDLMMSLGAVSVTLEDSGDQPLLEPPPGATPIWDEITLTGLFEADSDVPNITAAIENALEHKPSIRVEALEDKDWIREWMDSFQPILFGSRLWVCPSWLTPPQANAVNLMLDPGLAFGTGTHETTALCLQWLDGANIRDKVVVDFGCGSGILAIAAALLGAKRVFCIDNDPQALIATRQNGERNQILDSLDIFTPEQAPVIKADIVLANILATPLIQLHSKLSGMLQQGGHIVLSGILTHQAEMVRDQYAETLTNIEIVTNGDWVRINGQKTS